MNILKKTVSRAMSAVVILVSISGSAVTELDIPRWLELFEENMNALFSGKNADEAIHRTKTIAQIFSYKIGMLEGES